MRAFQSLYIGTLSVHINYVRTQRSQVYSAQFPNKIDKQVGIKWS